MTIRSLVASVFAVCSIALVLAPAEAFARSAGLAINRGPVVRSFAPRPALQSPVHIQQGRAFATKGAAGPGIHVTHQAPAKRFRRIFGSRLPRNGIGVFYGPVYSPDDFIGIGTPPLPEDDVTTIGRRCGPQAFVVPSESGGERTVTVTRCISE